MLTMLPARDIWRIYGSTVWESCQNNGIVDANSITSAGRLILFFAVKRGNHLVDWVDYAVSPVRLEVGVVSGLDFAKKQLLKHSRIMDGKCH
jgi:hypothetical protein